MRLSFDAIAEKFDAQRSLPREALVAWMQLIEELADGQLLEIIEPGIGTGRIALPLAARGHHITGTDISPQMLATCRELGDGLSLHLIEADATDLPFDEGQFQMGIIAQLLYLVPDWTAVLDELARVVQPGGHIIHLSEPTTEGAALRKWSSIWRTMIEDVGFRHQEFSPTEDDVRAEMLRRWPDVEVRPLASWQFGQSVKSAMGDYGERLRPLYATVDEADFDRTVNRFLDWASRAFPDASEELGGTVTLTATIAYT